MDDNVGKPTILGRKPILGADSSRYFVEDKSIVVSKRFRTSKTQIVTKYQLPNSRAIVIDQPQTERIANLYTTKMPFSKSRVAHSTATGGLSKTEEKTAQKYRKMKKMGLPEGAILHKMIADGIPTHIRDNVMAGGEAPQQTSRGASAMGRVQSKSMAGESQSSLSSQEEKIAAQYRKMLRIKMPRAAVSHKMIADGVSQKIQDSVMNGDAPQASSSPPTSYSRGGATESVSSVSTADEKLAASYRRLLRMKMPEAAVRHKMNADGVAQHIQDSVLRGEVANTSSSSSQLSSPGGTAGPESSLSKGDENIAAPYRKMMRMKMPEGAV